MEVSGQLHCVGVLTRGKYPLVPIREEDGSGHGGGGKKYPCTNWGSSNQSLYKLSYLAHPDVINENWTSEVNFGNIYFNLLTNW